MEKKVRCVVVSYTSSVEKSEAKPQRKRRGSNEARN